jgi:hypothetical protein
MSPAARLVFPAVVVLAVVVASCAAQRDAPSAAAPNPTGRAAPREQANVSKEANNRDDKPADSTRKIIRNGEIRVVVKAYDPARRAIEEMTARSGGFLASSQVNHTVGEVSSATLVLRVPATRFGDILRQIGRLGTVTYESTASQDITEQYFDLKARLANARKVEARLLELLAKSTGKVTDLLQVEKELARVREEIERFEGKLRLFDNLVDLSTLTVQLSIQERYEPPRPPSFGEDARQILRDSWQALRSFGRGLLLAVIALLPWIIPAAAIIWLVRRLTRGWRAKRAARKAERIRLRESAKNAKAGGETPKS